MCRGPTTTSNLCVFKHSIDDKLGVSFFADEHPYVRVRMVHPEGLAAVSGLQPDDVVLSINSHPCDSALHAARLLRESSGELWLTVERDLTCDVGDDEECSEMMLSPPRRLFSPPKSKDEVSQDGGNETAAAEDEEEDTYDEASADEWNEWLWWMIERIHAREAELSVLQQTTADELAAVMTEAEDEQPPSPPDEAAMADPVVMEQYMNAMAEYSVRQRDRLTAVDADNNELIEENREATAALNLLVARREELDNYRERVHELTEEDASRIEEIWRELARDGDEESGEEGVEGDELVDEQSDEAEEDEEPLIEEKPAATGASERGQRTKSEEDEEVECILLGGASKPAPIRAPSAATEKESTWRTLATVDVNAVDGRFGAHTGPLIHRVSCSSGTDKSSLMRQRLQRARSSSSNLSAATIGGATIDPWQNEMGVQVCPL